MIFSWYRGREIGRVEPPYLTPANVEVGKVFSADGPDCVGDQYFDGLKATGTTRATWLLADTIPADRASFEHLPIVEVEIIESHVTDATVRVLDVGPVSAWIERTPLDETSTISSIFPPFLDQEPLRRVLMARRLEPHLWVSPERTYHPLKEPDKLKAVFVTRTHRGWRCLVIPYSNESCYLIRLSSDIQSSPID